jgi:putative tricarboxylic transport membrane protein
MIQHPHFIYEVVAMTTLASITILLFGLFGVRPLLQVLRVKRSVLMPIVFLLCTVGAFASASRLFDVYVMLAIGIGAFLLRRRGYEMAPLAPCWTRACAAAWCCPMAAWRPSSRGPSASASPR